MASDWAADVRPLAANRKGTTLMFNHSLALAGAVLAILPMAPATQAEAAPSPPSIVTITLNVHGSKDRHGRGNGGNPKPVVRDILALVKAHNPDVIGVQEVCHRQHRAVRAELARLGYRATMTYTRASAGCDDRSKGNKFGNALYLKATKLTWRKSYALPKPINPEGTTGREPRRLLCARATLKGAIWTSCVTHIGPHDPDLTRQANRVSEIVTSLPGNVNAMGDWNSKSPKVKVPYRAGKGIDFVFSNRPVSLVTVADVPSSDHGAVITAS